MLSKKGMALHLGKLGETLNWISSENRQAGRVAGHSRQNACWDFIPNPENSKLPGLAVGRFFSAARPVGRLSFAASAAGVGRFFFAEEHFYVVPIHQQLAVFVAQDAVVGVGRALLGYEGAELGVEVFDLRQARQVALVEVSLRLAVLLDLVGMGSIKFARVAR